MGMNRWIAFLLAALLLSSTALPVFAAGAHASGVQRYDLEDAYGGLAPPENASAPSEDGDENSASDAEPS